MAINFSNFKRQPASSSFDWMLREFLILEEGENGNPDPNKDAGTNKTADNNQTNQNNNNNAPQHGGQKKEQKPAVSKQQLTTAFEKYRKEFTVKGIKPDSGLTPQVYVDMLRFYRDLNQELKQKEFPEAYREKMLRYLKEIAKNDYDGKWLLLTRNDNDEPEFTVDAIDEDFNERSIKSQMQAFEQIAEDAKKARKARKQQHADKLNIKRNLDPKIRKYIQQTMALFSNDDIQKKSWPPSQMDAYEQIKKLQKGPNNIPNLQSEATKKVLYFFQKLAVTEKKIFVLGIQKQKGQFKQVVRCIDIDEFKRKIDKYFLALQKVKSKQVGDLKKAYFKQKKEGADQEQLSLFEKMFAQINRLFGGKFSLTGSGPEDQDSDAGRAQKLKTLNITLATDFRKRMREQISKVQTKKFYQFWKKSANISSLVIASADKQMTAKEFGLTQITSQEDKTKLIEFFEQAFRRGFNPDDIIGKYQAMHKALLGGDDADMQKKLTDYHTAVNKLKQDHVKRKPQEDAAEEAKTQEDALRW